MVKNVRSMLKISYAGCLRLFPGILAQFTLEMCAAAKNCKKTPTTSILGFIIIQSHRY